MLTPIVIIGEMIKDTIGGYQALSTFGPYVKPAANLVIAYALGDLGIKFLSDGKQKSATSGTGNSLEHLKGKDGFIIAKKYQLSYKASVQNVAVIGPPGQHKTTPFIYPQLLRNHFPANSSIVVNDSKGELFRDTSRYQTKIGRKIVQFEPLGKSGHYNPLEFAETFAEVEKLATDILINGTLAVRLSSGNGGVGGNDAFWIKAATALLISSMIHHKDLKKSRATISESVKYIINTNADEIEETLGQSKNDLVREQFNKFSMAVEEGGGGPLSSMQMTLATNTSLYLDPQIIEKTSRSDFSYKMLRDERTCLYIRYYPEDANYLSPLMSIIYGQLISKCKKYDAIDKNNIIWLLDEAQNLGKIEGFSQTLNTCREAKFAFMVVLQSVSALVDIYGKNGTKSIMGALQTKCILPAYTDVETLREFTTLSGDEEINLQQENRKIKTKKNVFTPDEIRRLKVDEVLIISQNLNPIKAKQRRYYEDDDMLLNQYM